MELIGLIGVVALFIVWNVVGIRLILLARRTGGFPEFALGGGLFALAGIGYPLGVVGQISPQLEIDQGVVVWVTGLAGLFQNSGILLVALFTWRVFRKNALWAQALVAVAFSMLVFQAVGMTMVVAANHGSAEAGLAAILPWSVFGLGLAGAIFGWAGVETLMYRSLLLRRMALGLAEPVVVNRMALFSTVGLMSLVVAAFDIVALASGVPAMQAAVMLVTSMAGLVDSICLFLAFLPPRSYLAWIADRSAPQPA